MGKFLKIAKNRFFQKITWLGIICEWLQTQNTEMYYFSLGFPESRDWSRRLVYLILGNRMRGKAMKQGEGKTRWWCLISWPFPSTIDCLIQQQNPLRSHAYCVSGQFIRGKKGELSTGFLPLLVKGSPHKWNTVQFPGQNEGFMEMVLWPGLKHCQSVHAWSGWAEREVKPFISEQSWIQRKKHQL